MPNGSFLGEFSLVLFVANQCAHSTAGVAPAGRARTSRINCCRRRFRSWRKFSCSCATGWYLSHFLFGWHAWQKLTARRLWGWLRYTVCCPVMVVVGFCLICSIEGRWVSCFFFVLFSFASVWADARIVLFIVFIEPTAQGFCMTSSRGLSCDKRRTHQP